MSGIKIKDDAVNEFNQLKDKHAHKFISLGFTDDLKEVEVKDIGPKDSTFEDLLKVLPKDHVRYIFYDCAYTKLSGEKRNKVIFVAWSSDDDAPLKEKVLITSTMGEIKAKCTGFAKGTAINDFDEMMEENFINIVSENRAK